MVLPAAGAALAIGLLAAGILVPWWAAWLGARSERRQAPARAALAVEVLESARYGAELAVLGQGDARRARIVGADARLAALGRRKALTLSLTGAATHLVQGLTVLGVLVVAIGPAADGRPDGILLAALVLVTLGVFEVVLPLPASALSLAACAAASKRIMQVAAVSPAGVAAPPAAPETMPAGRALRLRGVDLRGDADGPLILNGVDLDVAEGGRRAHRTVRRREDDARGAARRLPRP